ncbi:MAG: dTDP-4-dehydrorhamnose 3,5-epimerase [Bacteroidales bacterium]|nr:dTDP-4-dehydrorhamnose 3,5-epimerase [Bacteroidales bacterium]MBN2763077.1 dTDP-4-dehydrorhamnose 3,5-epimerase [Bacteroidales bacterium]
MEITATALPGLFIIKPEVFSDQRGYFYESFNEKKLSQGGLKFRFVQDNQSKSVYGVIRGLHYQLEPYAQTKLVRVLSGKIRDIAVDIRKNSPTFGKSFSLDLSCENKLQLLVPKGFAHGFSVLSETAVVLYKTDDYYRPSAERGIFYNDETLAIDWGLKPGKEIVAERDKAFPLLKNAEMNYTFPKI